MTVVLLGCIQLHLIKVAKAKKLRISISFQIVLTIVPESIISVTRLITRSKAGSVCRVPEIFTMMEVVPLRKIGCCHPHDDNDDIFYDK